MSDKIYTIKDNVSGKTFKVRLDHRPTPGEMSNLSDREAMSSMSASEKAIEKIASMPVVQPPSRSQDMEQGLIGGLESIPKSALNLVGGAGQALEMASNPYYMFEHPPDFSKGVASQIPIVSNFINAYKAAKSGNYRTAGEQAGEGILGGYVLGRSILGGEQIPEEAPSKDVPIKRPVQPSIVTSEKVTPKQEPELSRPMISDSSGSIQGQLEQPDTPKQLTTRRVLRTSPQEISPKRVIVSPRIAAFGSMKQGLQEPTFLPPNRIAGELPPAPEQLLLGGGEQPQLPEEAGRANYKNKIFNPPKRLRSSKIISSPEINRTSASIVSDPNNRELIERYVGLLKANGTPVESVLNDEALNKADPVMVKTAINRQYGEIPLSEEQQIGKTETGYSARKLKGLGKRLRQELSSRGITIGPLEDEPEGTEFYSGLGALQKLPDLIKMKPEAPREQPGEIENLLFSPTKTLEQFPQTKNMALQHEIDIQKMYADQNRGYSTEANLFNGLTDEQKNTIKDLLRNYDNPYNIETAKKYPASLLKRAVAIRNDMLNERDLTDAAFVKHNIIIPRASVGRVGFLHNYLPNMKAYEGEDFPGLFEKHLRSSGLLDLFRGRGEPSIYGESKLPSASSILTRKGNLTNREEDLQKIYHSYKQSMIKVRHLRPLYAKWLDLLNNEQMPPRLQEAVKTVMKQIRSPQLDDERLASAMNRLAAVTQGALYTVKLAAYPTLQVLHFSNLFTQALPMLGPKNMLVGLKYFMRHPVRAVRAVDLTTPPGQDIPWKMQSLPGKIKTISMLANFGYRSSKAMTLAGFIKQAQEEGFKGNDAFSVASHRMHQTFGFRPLGSVSPIIQTMRLNPFLRFLTTYRTTLYNLAENYARGVQNAVNLEPGFKEAFYRLMGYISTGAITYAIYKKYHIPLTHFSWRLLGIETGFEGMKPVLTNLAKGDINKAASEFAKFAQPIIMKRLEGDDNVLRELFMDEPKSQGVTQMERKYEHIPSVSGLEHQYY